MTIRYNTRNIRDFLTDGFSDGDLRRFCYYELDFRPVFNQLNQATGKDQIIDELIQYAEQKELIEMLLALSKKSNPASYAGHWPYYDDDDDVIPPTNHSDEHEKDSRDNRILFWVTLAVILVFGIVGVFIFQQVMRDKGKIILSEYTEIFNFDDGGASEWKPFVWDAGWVDYVDNGNVEVMGSDFVRDGHSGPFLKYPLDLKAEDIYASTIRNAIYKPIDKKIIGIVANVFYESDPHYSLEEIRAGFVVPFRVGNGELLRNEDYLKKLTPNKWNTIIWSLYGPVWWASKDKDEAWNNLRDLFGDEAYNLQVGRDLHDEKIEKIGIQFIVNSEGGSKEFKGTAYIDNIVLVYEHP